MFPLHIPCRLMFQACERFGSSCSDWLPCAFTEYMAATEAARIEAAQPCTQQDSRCKQTTSNCCFYCTY